MLKPATSSASSPEQISSDRNEPKYKGVRKRKWGKWVSEIRLPNSRERIWLGSYDTPEKAARAFDAALYCLRGRGAKFNFPDNPPDNIDGGQSLSPQEIQAVASRYANENPNPNATTTRMSRTGESSSQAMDQYASSSEDNAIDWSFLNSLGSNEGVSKFELYSVLDNMGNEYFPPPPPPPFDDGEDHNTGNDDHNGDEDYSQQSFLWNFN
ncbi:hypothetical protein JCGZ_07576 [Jatropha curcas]|uniref:AP2/ERF domain-containing protein n=1 Tax=Jatropha curcas TaxID=180498 RepID=A0A067KNY6_JATCU|nr:ethylene-responsive transcription factor ERF017 [Jatropha curcas]KDP34005.1 hypothetical protein JCGZ_07576 [Jatropha curcas]